MELKQYQQDTLNDLATYMEQLAEDNDLQKAYRNFWLKKGIDISNIEKNTFIHSYDNTIKGVPRVMFKVPTAGGKTFIAANALKVIFDHLPAEHPKVVAWFVPSDSILTQTYRNLCNPAHPYCQRINSHFNNRVVVVDKEKALAGTEIQPGQINEQLTIFVLSVQSFAANNKDGRRVFRENSSLAAYATAFGEGNKIDGADETSLIQAIAHLNPVVIIDESHNFEAKLRIELFEQINPSFILDLTATPRQKSNIISFVDAKKLKDANMVKLPVVLYNRDSTTDVLLNAITLRRTLEKRANELRMNGGHYIRPIVLVQAQPKSDADNETFEKVKQKLIEVGINENHIKIKTAGKDEIKGIDLMSEDCEVRYIITVNALKEGWDCPFAYILASLANKTSRIDVEQIVGRVLRLPYTTRHKDEFLNMSYVFTSSNNFRETVESVIRGLNNAGFSSKDTRIVDTDGILEKTEDVPNLQTGLFGTNTTEEQKSVEGAKDSGEENSATEDFDIEELKQKLESQEVSVGGMEKVGTSAEDANATNSGTANPIVDDILKHAQKANVEYENDNKDDSGIDIPTDIKDKVMTYELKDLFREVAEQMQLPIFMKKVERGNIFNPDSGIVKLNKTILTEGFVLEKADKNINFSRSEQEAVAIDLEERSKGEYVPKQYKMNSSQLHEVRELFVGYGVEAKRRQLLKKIAKRLQFDEVNEPHISHYIEGVLEDKSDEELVELFNNELMTERAFKHKIDSLVADYQYQNFKEWLDMGKIVCSLGEGSYRLPKNICPTKKATGLSKGLYLEEDGDINNFEYKVIASVANLDNVLFWHRNPERGNNGFCINGFINHYPDFIVRTKNGCTVLLETKGDDRDNSDSRRKLELGKTWENKAGDKYRYFMVFDKTTLDGAHTLEKFLEILKEL